MPYTSTPPISCSASKTWTWCPFWTRSPAAVRPEGPLPTMATFFPVGGAFGSVADIEVALLVVGDEALQISNAQRLNFLAHQAAAFAVVFLRADAPGDGGQHVVFADFGGRAHDSRQPRSAARTLSPSRPPDNRSRKPAWRIPGSAALPAAPVPRNSPG